MNNVNEILTRSIKKQLIPTDHKKPPTSKWRFNREVEKNFDHVW